MTEEEVQIGSTETQEEEVGTSGRKERTEYNGPEIRNLQERDPTINTFLQHFQK